MYGNLPNQLQSVYKRLRTTFWSNPHRLNALRATIAMGVSVIPFVAVNKPYFGITLALGVLAGALSETDDHPRGRIKSLSITVCSFFISAFSVGLLQTYPLWLGLGFIGSTFIFILIGGINERYRAITFGSILVGIYAMLGINNSPDWYWQAILLPGGALFHGLLSLFLLTQKPLRPLDEQMANGFKALSNYLEKKAAMISSNDIDPAKLNHQLALLNINVVGSLEKIKEVLNNYGREVKDTELLRPYLQRFMLLQSLHERAASSHIQFEKLNPLAEKQEILEGIGEMLRQLSYASNLLAGSMLTGIKYRHPQVLEWISAALENKIKILPETDFQDLLLLHHNLNRSHLSLKYLDDMQKGTSAPRLRKDERTVWERIKAQLTLKHPRMRYAIRLNLSFTIGFIIFQHFQLEKGAWIMLTSLFVSQIAYSDTRRRLVQRVLGTITGIVVGVISLQIFSGIAAEVLVFLTAAMAFFYWLRSNYSISVIFITIFVLFGFSLINNEGNIGVLIPRLIDTIIGGLLSFIMIRFLWPGWQYRRLPELISKAMTKNLAYFIAIVQAFNKPTIDDLDYRIARREAHLADNELALAWNSMKLEPKSKQRLMQHTFHLTYLNHALISYLSALGIQREQHKLVIKQSDNIINTIKLMLQQSGDSLLDDRMLIPENLSTSVHLLREEISKSNATVETQQLRLFYNITTVCNQMMNELQEIRKSILPVNK